MSPNVAAHTSDETPTFNQQNYVILYTWGGDVIISTRVNALRRHVVGIESTVITLGNYVMFLLHFILMC